MLSAAQSVSLHTFSEANWAEPLTPLLSTPLNKEEGLGLQQNGGY